VEGEAKSEVLVDSILRFVITEAALMAASAARLSAAMIAR
jgi:hypothetical protein